MNHKEIQEICNKIVKCDYHVGERYYKSKNDIYDRKKWTYVDENTLIEDPYRANNTLASGWLKILIDQKINYSLGNPFDIEIEEVNRNIRNGITSTSKEASKKSIGWGYVYVKNGELALKTMKPEEIMPVYADEEYGVLEKAYRCYKLNEQDRFDIITKEGTEKYVKKDKEYIFEIFKPHLTIGMRFGKIIKGQTGKGWENVPLIPLYNNEEKVSDLYNIKGLVDIYDIVNSDFANNLEDIQDAFAVVKGFDGDDPSKLLNNIKQYKVARVASDGDFKLETQEIPHVAKGEFLKLTRQNIFISGMGFDTDTVGEGNATNYIIQMRLSNLKLKASAFEKQVQEFMFRLLPFINEFYNKKYTEDDTIITFNRQTLVNETELLATLKDYKGIISDYTLYEQIPFTEPQKENERIEEEKEVIEIPEEIDEKEEV